MKASTARYLLDQLIEQEGDVEMIVLIREHDQEPDILRIVDFRSPMPFRGKIAILASDLPDPR